MSIYHRLLEPTRPLPGTGNGISDTGQLLFERASPAKYSDYVTGGMFEQPNYD